MNTFMRFSILISAAALSLSGCGFQPMYGNYSATATQNTTPSSLSQVAIDIIPDREGQLLRNNLIDRLYKNGYPTTPIATLQIKKLDEVKTELDLTKSSEATRAQLRLTTVMQLIDATTGKIVINKTVKTVTSYNILESEFATRVTEDSARQNAINDLARQIELNLSLYYASK
jgi:LPS-assembly lipoprotein